MYPLKAYNAKSFDYCIHTCETTNIRCRTFCACFDGMGIKMGTAQRRLTWPLCKDDTQIHRAFPLKKKKDAEHFHLPLKTLCCSLSFITISLILLFGWYFFFCAWLLLLTTIILSFILVVLCISRLFIFLVE